MALITRTRDMKRKQLWHKNTRTQEQNTTTTENIAQVCLHYGKDGGTNAEQRQQRRLSPRQSTPMSAQPFQHADVRRRSDGDGFGDDEHDERRHELAGEDATPPPPLPPPDEFLARFASHASEFLRNAYLSDRPLRHAPSSSFLTTSLCEDVHFGVCAQLAVLDGYLASACAAGPLDVEAVRTEAVYSLLHAMYCKQLAYRDRLLPPPAPAGSEPDDPGSGGVGGDGDGGGLDGGEHEGGEEGYEVEEEDWERCLAAANDFHRLMERTEEALGGLHGLHPHLRLAPGPHPPSAPMPMPATTGAAGAPGEGSGGRVGGDGDDDDGIGGEGGDGGLPPAAATSSSPPAPAPPPQAPPPPQVGRYHHGELSGLLHLYATDAVHAARRVSLAAVWTMERSSIVDDLFGPRWETILTKNEVAMSIVRTAEDYLADVEAGALNDFLRRKATEAMIEATVAFYATCLVRRVDRIRRRARRARKNGAAATAAAATRRAVTVTAGKGRAAAAAAATLARGRNAPPRPSTAGGVPDAEEGGGPPRPFLDPVAAARRMGDDVRLMKGSFKAWAILSMPVLDGTIEREFGALEAACSCLRAAAGVVAHPDYDDNAASASSLAGGVPADFVSALHERTGGDVAVTRRFMCDLWYMAVPDEGGYDALPRSVEDELRRCEDRGAPGGRGGAAVAGHPRYRVDRGITLESALAEAYFGGGSEVGDDRRRRRSGLPGTIGAGKENSSGGGAREPRVDLPAAAREMRSLTCKKLSKVHMPKNVSKARVKKTASSFLKTCKRAGHLQKT